MKLTRITLSLAEREMYTIHEALESSVKEYIESAVALTPDWDTVDDLKEEIKLLQEINQSFGYKCAIWPENHDFGDYKQYDDVDEWAKALVEIEKSKLKKDSE